jgi:hypothetical protein
MKLPIAAAMERIEAMLNTAGLVVVFIKMKMDPKPHVARGDMAMRAEKMRISTCDLPLQEVSRTLQARRESLSVSR